MSVNLSKGGSVSLDKHRYDLESVMIGCGWEVAKPGLLDRAFGGNQDYDLDIVTIALRNGRLENTGGERLEGSDVCFFNNQSIAEGCIEIGEDDRSGASSDGGDDEQVHVLLGSLDSGYDRIVFLVQIYDAAARNQDFSRIQNAYVRAVDGSGKEMARFSLSGAGNARSVLFAELRRTPQGWDFKAIGETSRADSFTAYLNDFVAGRR